MSIFSDLKVKVWDVNRFNETYKNNSRQGLQSVATHNRELILNNFILIPKTTKHYVKDLNNFQAKQKDYKLINEKTNINNHHNIIVTNETTDECVRRLWSEGFRSITILNFANSNQAGGGYREGDSTQEEEICRCAPSLYASLNMYKYPFDNENEILYTENVPFIRKSRKCGYELLDNSVVNSQDFPYANVITAAAPDLRFKSSSSFNVEKLTQLISAIVKLPISLSEKQNTEKQTLVLGAFGNGAFLNPPEITSSIFKIVLTNLSMEYTQVIFAIPISKDQNHTIFKNCFE
jgi:uncharacterized protein (TIGR02452 family)